MIITLDIETCPCQNPAVREEIRANIKAPAQYKKPESIAQWLEENAEAETEAAWRKTSFDGAHGHIAVIGMAFDDEEPIALYSEDWHADEDEILRQAFQLIDWRLQERPNERPRFVGHNLVGFDLRFIFQRCVVLGVKPSRHIPFAAKPWDDMVYDTMLRWNARDFCGLDKICKALGLGGKGEIDGSQVWNYVRDGRIAEVAEYCRKDVQMTRALYKRMNFLAEAA